MSEEVIVPDQVKNFNKGQGEYFGPEDELSPEEIAECKRLAEEELVLSNAFDKNLNLEIDDDIFKVPGQNVALISFIGPYELLKVKHDTLQFNIRGACNDGPSAIKRIQKISKLPDGNKYDIFSIGMYEWVAIPPNLEFMQSVEKHENYLNSLVIQHKRELEVKKQLFERRKQRINETKPTDKDSDSDSDSEDGETIESTVASDGNSTGKPVSAEIKTIEPMDDPKQSTTNEDEFDPMEKLNMGSISCQDWCIISLLGHNIKEGMALKIQGFYESEDDARKVLDRMKKADDTFESYLVESYRWLPAEPNVDDIEDQVYQDERLNAMNQTHLDEKRKAQDYNLNQRSKGKIPQMPSLEPPISTTESNVEIEILGEDDEVTASEVLKSLE